MTPGWRPELRRPAPESGAARSAVAAVAALAPAHAVASSTSMGVGANNPDETKVPC